MAGPRGYHSYRGRSSKGKLVLAVLLVLVILASVGFMMMQKYIVYDETGTPKLVLPEKTEESQPPEAANSASQSAGSSPSSTA